MTKSKDIVAAIHDAARYGTSGNLPLALHEPDVGTEERAAVMGCLDSGWTSSAGSLVNEFEDRLAEFCGVSNVVACVNGTAALHIALNLVGVLPGDEVIVPAVSFIATANAVVYNQAIPHFVDVSEEDFGIDPVALGAYLDEIGEQRNGNLFNKNTGRRIAGIIPVHCFGYPCRIEEIVALGEDLGVPVVEDAAEALGSFYKGRTLGAFGAVSILSFNGNKIITTGGGGAIITNDERLAVRARHLTTTAKLAHKWEYNHDELGYNYRMPSLNAALGIGQLGRMDEFLKSKAALHQRYASAFSVIDDLRLIEGRRDSQPNHWLNSIVLSKSLACVRDEIIMMSHDAGLMVRPLWGLLPDQQHLKGGTQMNYPVARSLAARTICLPSSSVLGKA